MIYTTFWRPVAVITITIYNATGHVLLLMLQMGEGENAMDGSLLQASDCSDSHANDSPNLRAFRYQDFLVCSLESGGTLRHVSVLPVEKHGW